MKLMWLEKLAESGVIRKEALEHIYKDIKGVVKEASTMGGITPEEFTKHLHTVLGFGIMGGAAAAGKAVWNKIDQSRGRDALMKSRAAVVAKYKDAPDIEKAQARFDEIAQYAPHVAMNVPLAMKLVDANLNTGITDETAQRLALIQAQYTTKVLDQNKYLPKTASVRPEVVGEMTADLYIMSKTASFFSGKDMKKFVTTVGAYSLVPLISGGVSGLANLALDKSREKSLREKMDASFREAVHKAPEVHRDIFLQDPVRTREAFDALSHFAPHVAMQPHAARTFIKKMLDYYDQGGMNVTDVKELTEIEKNIAGSTKPRGFSKGFEFGTGFSAGGPVGKGVERATNDLLEPGPPASSEVVVG